MSSTNFPPFRSYSRLLARHKLSDIVSLYLISEIVRCRLNKGDRFPVNEHIIAQALGVNRLSVNRAWQQLESDEIVEIRHGVGIVIRNPDRIALDEGSQEVYLEIRREADTHLARLASRKAAAKDIKAMQVALDKQAHVVDQLKKLNRFQDENSERALLIFQLFLTDLEFHCALRQAARDPWLETIAEIAEMRTQAVRFASLNSREYLSEILHSHQATFEAIRARREEDSAKAAVKHFETARKSARAEHSEKLAE